MKISDKRNDDGLPEIADRLKGKKPIIFVMMAVILVIVASVFYFGKTDKKVSQLQDDSYSPQQSVAAEILKPVLEVIPTQAQNSKTDTSALPTLTQEQISFIQAKQNELQQRLSAPLMLVNSAPQNGAEPKSAQSNPVSNDRNTQFMNQVSAQGVESATATTIGPLNSLIAAGNMIHAILESATNSDLPGFVRAVVSEPGYSEDGTAVLIPRGSRLIGKYKSGMLQGQSRIFMVWTRLITPNGISIQLCSPGIDSLGVAGIGADGIDRHFWQRFGTASLLSMIGTGVANAGVSGSDQDNSASAYRSQWQIALLNPRMRVYSKIAEWLLH